MIITAEKKSLLLYYDYKSHFDFLTDEQVGKIVRAMLEYEVDGVLPEFDETIMKMTFSFVKSNLDRDRKKWVKMCKTNKENGSKGGRPKSKSDEEINDELPEEQTTAENVECSSSDDETTRKKAEFYSKFKEY